MPDGAGGFTQDFSGPALLRIPLGHDHLRLQGYHLLRRRFPTPSTQRSCTTAWSYYPAAASTTTVWAVPRSLTTTWGITVVFSSSAYLDVSVQPVRPPINRGLRGCPIRKSSDQRSCAAPRSLSQLYTSFIASLCQGIHRVLFLSFFSEQAPQSPQRSSPMQPHLTIRPHT